MDFHSGEPMILLVLLAILAFLALALYLRYRQGVLRHNERLTALEKGVPLPDLAGEKPKAPFTPRIYLLRGLLWLFVGISISLVMLSFSLSTQHEPDMTYRLWSVRSMRENGATEEQVKQYLANPGRERNGMPIGVASIGLIPIAVGVAYLLFYKKETEV